MDRALLVHLAPSLAGLDAAAAVIDQGGVIVLWNEAAERLLGFSSSEVLNHHCWEVVSPAWNDRVMGALQFLREARFWQGQADICGRSGQVVTVAFQAVPWGWDANSPVGWLLLGRAAAAPAALDGLPLPELLDSLPDALVCVNDQRQVLFQNAAARRLFGRDGESAPASLPLPEILDQLKVGVPNGEPCAGSRVRSLEGRDAEGRRANWEVTWGHGQAGGRRIWLVSARPASHHQQIQNVVHQSQKRQVIGALAAGIAHDFNNILAAVIANLDLALLDENLSAGAKDVILRAQVGARRGAELNAKLLSFSRHSETRPAPVDLRKVTDEALFILRRGLEKRIQIHFAPPADLWPAQADENQIIQVLMNLCLNARDAMPHGGTLTIEAANVTFRTEEISPPRRAGNFVRLTVSDTGIGMPPEVLQRLFEPYFTTKAYGKGAGLSLCIAHHVLDEHGGWMEVASRVGEGSQFHLFLPRALPSDQPAVVPSSEISTATRQATEGTETILVVDDEPSILVVLRAMLQFRGYKVIEAGHGEEGLRKFQNAGSPVDLVLLDVNMPGWDGWDTLARLRQMDARVPVLMLSGGGTEDVETKTAELGATGMLEKPFKNQELLAAVRATLDQARDENCSRQ